MKPLMRLVTGLALLAVLLVLVAYALPQDVTIARSKVINAPESDVFPYVNSPRRFNEWSPWAARDPDAEYVYSGPESGEGARMDWTSDHPEVGSGTQKIVESRPDRYVRVSLDFGEMGMAHATYELQPAGAGTRLVWLFQADVGDNPLRRWMGLMLDRWLGWEYEKGLERLKKLVESQK